VPDPTPTSNGDAAVLEDDDDLLEDGAPDLDDIPGLDEPEPVPDDAAIDELTDGFGADEVGDEPLDPSPPLAAFEPLAAPPTTVSAGDDLADRLARLELATQTLVQAQAERDGHRVHRKVSAASLGAFAAAAIPVLLDLAGALNLSPELTSTISAGAALVGAFAAGWVTPERAPTVPPELLRP
jgi:hypothetical protein